MDFNFNPSMHTSILLIASLLLIVALIVRNRYTHLIALGMVIFELIRFLLIYPAERLHMSIDLVIVGLIGISCFISRYRTMKFLMALSGFAILIGHHYKEFLPAHSPETTGITIATASTIVPIDSELELMVQFSNQSELQAWMDKHGEEYVLTYPLFTPLDKSFVLDEYVGINLPDSSLEDIRKTISVISQYSEVENVEMNELVSLDQQPVSTLKKLVNDARLDKQWISDSYRLEDYHRLVKGRKAPSSQSATVIAILDTGVEGAHEDLKGNYLSTSSRFDKDVRGHGTHCAGIAAAVTGNKLGIASLLPSSSPVKVTGIKVLTDRGIGTQKGIIDGIIKAADLGYSVISMSLGGLTNDKRQQAYKKAVDYATAKGAIVVTAAGNSSQDARRYSPANTPGVITVAAVGPNQKLASFSNFVSGLEMGIAAPGVNIHSTFPDNEYKSQNGTSMAAPFISGLVGLMKHYNPELTTKQAYQYIEASADMVDGVPVVNPLKTLQAFFSKLDSVSE